MRPARSSCALSGSVVTLLWALCAQVPAEGAPSHHHAKKAGTAGAIAAGHRRHGRRLATAGFAAEFSSFEAFVNPWPNIQKFQTSFDLSHNWCPIKEAILSGKLHFADALRGQNVSFLLALQDNPVSVSYNKTSRMIKGGMPVEVFEEVARRAGFKWRGQSAVVQYIDRAAGEKDEDWLNWGTQHFDVVDWFTITPERTRRGLTFAYPFVDLSPHLVGQLVTYNHTVMDRYLKCFSPFTPSLWLMIGVGFFLSACVYVLLEAGGDDIPQKTVLGSTTQAFYLQFCSFTGGGGYAPRTPAGKLFLMSASFLVMLLVTAYTANLASEMIIDKVVHSPIHDVQEAIDRNLKICVRSGSPFFRLMSREYPEASLFLVDTEQDKAKAIMRGDCVAALVGLTWWDFEQRMSKYNPNCTLYSLGRKIMDMRGSFVAQATSATCKEVVIDVLTFTMHDMYLDGFLNEVAATYQELDQDIYCPTKGAAKSVAEKMSPRHMVGIFWVHGIISVICVAVSVYLGHFAYPGCGSCRAVSDVEDNSKGFEGSDPSE